MNATKLNRQNPPCLCLILLLAAWLPWPALLWSANVKIVSDLPYKSGAGLSDYERERCYLDLYLPQDAEGFPVLVWFHGGGLQNGTRNDDRTVAIAKELASSGLAVASVGYRLSPQVHFPAYIEDAAAAVAWTKRHIARHGGNSDAVFVGGHSAGGYLTLMVGLDPRYLQAHDLELSAVAGLIPVSGQTMDHSTVREERGGGRYPVTAGESAPIYYARESTPPILAIYADDDLPGRRAENEYLVAMMKGAGNERVEGILIRDRDHGTVAFNIAETGDPARQAILEFVRRATTP